MSESSRIRVLIVDDHAVVRSGLAAFLMAFDDLELTGEAGSGTEALVVCAEARPDVVLMDLVLPDMDGASVTRRIREAWPQIRVIALSSFWDEALVQAVLRAGAMGYLLKDVTAEELARAIMAAHAGRPTLAPEVAQTLITQTAQGWGAGHNLTPREREVLALMVAGLSNAEIAKRLVVSLSTIKFFVSSILAKLGVTSRVAAVAMAVQRHLVN